MSEHCTTNLDILIKQAVLEAVKNSPLYPGYPSVRLTAKHPEVASQLADGRIMHLPDGPWDAGVKFLQPQTEEELHLLRLQGYDFDEAGRPLHPWLVDMLSNTAIGVVTGTGRYWRMGPNYTGDPIVVTNEDTPHVLLVLRRDNDMWAVPGGFVDKGETAEQAGRREAWEETGLILPDQTPITIYEGVVADARTTAYAWAKTTACLWRIDKQAKLTHDPKEVKAAKWFAINNLPDSIHGSHGVLLEESFKHI